MATLTLNDTINGKTTLIVGGDANGNVTSTDVDDFFTNNGSDKANVIQITLEDSVINVGDNCFQEYFTSVTTVSGGNNVESVGQQAFKSCISLTDISLPTATSVGLGAFAFCTSLTDISIPLVTSVGDQAFDSCTSLTDISLPSVTTIGAGGIFNQCNNLANVSMDSLESIPDGDQIELFAGTGLLSLANVSFASVNSIGNVAFHRCTSLTDISIPLATSVGEQAFRECSLLTNISLPAATSVGQKAFVFCSSLTNINLALVTSVGDYAFSDCTSLKFLNLPNATSIGAGFINNTGITNATSFSNGVVLGDKQELDKHYKSNEEYNQIEEDYNSELANAIHLDGEVKDREATISGLEINLQANVDALINMTANYESEVETTNQLTQDKAGLEQDKAGLEQDKVNLNNTISEKNTTISQLETDLQSNITIKDGLQVQVDNSPIDLTDSSFELSDVLTLVNKILN